MNAKKMLALLLILVLSFGVYGCGMVDVMKDRISNEGTQDVEIIESNDGIAVLSDINTRETVLYFENEMGYIVPVKRNIPWEEGIAKAALRNMVASPTLSEEMARIGLKPVLAAGTEILGMSINDGVCKVNFSSQFTQAADSQAESNMIEAVTYTLTEFDAINTVQIMIEDEYQSSLPYGTQINVELKRENINQLAEANEGQSLEIIYYEQIGSEDYEYYVPVTMPISIGESKTTAVVEKLFERAVGLSEFYTDIPVGVTLNDVEVRSGVAFVDVTLDSEDAIASQLEFDKMKKNIALTLSEFEEIESVQILIDDKGIEEAGFDFLETDEIPVFANEY